MEILEDCILHDAKGSHVKEETAHGHESNDEKR